MIQGKRPGNSGTRPIYSSAPRSVPHDATGANETHKARRPPVPFTPWSSTPSKAWQPSVGGPVHVSGSPTLRKQYLRPKSLARPAVQQLVRKRKDPEPKARPCPPAKRQCMGMGSIPSTLLLPQPAAIKQLIKYRFQELLLACADRTTDSGVHQGVFDSKEIKIISGFGMIKVATLFCRDINLSLLLFTGPKTICPPESRWQWLQDHPDGVFVDAGNKRYFSLLSQLLRALPESDTKTRLRRRQVHTNQNKQCDWVEAALAFLRSHWGMATVCFLHKQHLIEALPNISSRESCAHILHTVECYFHDVLSTELGISKESVSVPRAYR